MRRTDIIDPDAGKFVVEDIVHHTRFVRPITLKTYLIVGLWFPFGVLLVIIRALFVLMSELFLFRLSRWFHFENAFYKVYRFVCGVIVTTSGEENWKEKPRVIVCNHISDFDIVALRGTHNVAAVSPLYYQTFWLTREMVKAIHPLYVSLTDRQYVRDQIQNHLKTSDIPILVFPEGGLSSGKTCLMQYHQHLFSLGLPIHPMTMTSRDPFDSMIHDHYLCTVVTTNILVFFWKPYHVYHLHHLPPVSINPGETSVQFADRVQHLTADELGLFASPFSIRDKAIMVRKWMSIRSGKRSFVHYPRKTNRSGHGSATAVEYPSGETKDAKQTEETEETSKGKKEGRGGSKSPDRARGPSFMEKRRENKDTLFLTRQARLLTPTDNLDSVKELLRDRTPRKGMTEPKK